MSNKEIQEFNEKLRRGLELAEKTKFMRRDFCTILIIIVKYWQRDTRFGGFSDYISKTINSEKQ